MRSCLLSLGLLLLLLLTCSCSSEENTCSSCGAAAGGAGAQQEALSPELLEAVKSHILSRLQMKVRPNITQPVARAAMVTALRKLHAGRLREDGRMEIPHLDGHATPEEQEENSEIISFAERDEALTSSSSLFFLISSEGNQKLFVSRATLWIYFRLQHQEAEPRPGRRRKVTVKVYSQEPGLSSRWNLVEKRVELRRSGWHTFPLTDAVRMAFQAEQDGARRQNLDVRCEGCEEEGVASVLLEDDAHRPFLVLQARRGEAGRRRRKRGLECDGNAGLCCRQQFYIDFRVIGWNDWIIAPSGYFGNYCEGSCPAYMAGVPGSASSFHTAVVNQYRLRGMSPGAMSSCCIPTRLSTMSMLYFDDEYNIVKRDVPNMIVEECGCA